MCGVGMAHLEARRRWTARSGEGYDDTLQADTA